MGRPPGVGHTAAASYSSSRHDPASAANGDSLNGSIRRNTELWLLHNIGIKHPVLLQIMRDCVLSQKRRLQADFSADPFSFVVGSVERMVTTSATAELGAEIRTLNLVELLESAPGFIAHRAGNIDL
jgi:hypothetical protein